MKLRAPFPWFGGKSRASSLVWEGLGDVSNYVEPFAGSLAVLLGRPSAPGTETVNDIDCYVANFWRAIAADPEKVAFYADWPVNETDLHARHRWLVDRERFRERMRTDPKRFDARIAGWWVWGLSMWIGGGWCSTRPLKNGEVPSEQRKRPRLDGGAGVHRQLPAIGVAEAGNGSSMRGVHAARFKWRRGDAGNVQLNVNANGRGIRKITGGNKRPRLTGNAPCGVQKPSSRSGLVAEFEALAARLRDVRVCCGDWSRVLTPAVTTGHGLTGVVLDPPYDDGERARGIYACDDGRVSAAVRAWAIENGESPLLRIVLCGYEGEHAMPPTWRVREWKAAGGFGSQRRDRSNANAARERLWFSPACLIGQKTLFDATRGAL